MKALKVFHRTVQGQLQSALPLPYALYYAEGVKRVPYVGKLLVYLDNRAGFQLARGMAGDASTWYKSPHGQIEIWRVECHNLYTVPIMISASDLNKVSLRTLNPMRFWNLVLTGTRKAIDRAVGEDRSIIPIPCSEIWATDWVIPRERIQTLAHDDDGRWKWQE